jgi:ribosomal protein L11 methyltransferase
MPKINDSQYIQVVIPNDRIETEILTGKLYLMDCLGTQEDGSVIRAFFRYEKYQELKEAFQTLFQQWHLPPEFSIELCEVQPWQTNWQNYFKTQRISKRIGIRPPWRHFRKPVPIEIVIQPSMAFGTGTHATTQLALMLLEKYLLPGWRVLDAGCGTGILSIAALKLGAQSVDAWDVDPEIRENFHENLRLNKVPRNYHLHLGDVLVGDNWDYDLILSNIERKVNEKVLEQIVARRARPRIIFTGLLAEECTDFIARVLNYHRAVIDKRIKKEWAAIVVE